jgi:hypothetical protein
VRLAVTSGARLRFRLARRLGAVPLFERRVRTGGSAVVAACLRLEPGTYLLVVTARSGRRIAAALGSLDVNATRGGPGRLTLRTPM